MTRTLSEAQKAKISDASRRSWQDPEYRKKVTAHLWGHTTSEETRRKISESHKGLKGTRNGMHNSPEHNAKISAANKGKTRTAECKHQISETKKSQNLHLTPEHKLRISEANKGRVPPPMTPEHKAQLIQLARNRTPWNKGLTKETSPKLAEIGKKTSAKLKGFKQSKETRLHMSMAKKGIHLSEEHKQKIRIANTGKHHSAESKEKMSLAKIGKSMTHVYTDDDRQRLSQRFKGRKFSDETRAKMSLSHLGKKLSPEQLTKISIANKNNWREHPERKQQQSEQQKARFSNPEERELQSIRAKISHSNPDVRKRISDGAKLGLVAHPEAQIARTTKLKQWRNRHPEFSKRFKGKGNPFYGKKHSPESLAKMSIASSGRTGEKANNWQGGLTKLPYSKDFNKLTHKIIRVRDKHTCQLCGNKGNSVHHIDYDKLNSHSLNLICLCKKCHGTTNANRPYWQDYFTNLMINRFNPNRII